jgi:hypothetical protein
MFIVCLLPVPAAPADLVRAKSRTSRERHFGAGRVYAWDKCLLAKSVLSHKCDDRLVFQGGDDGRLVEYSRRATKTFGDRSLKEVTCERSAWQSRCVEP